MTASRQTSTRPTVVGVFHERSEAERAIQQLKQAGFRDEQIGYAHRGEDEAHKSGAPAASAKGEETTDTGPGSGAATGAITGGVLGALAGAAASLLIPGVGPVIAAGMLGPLLGAAVGGAALGAAGGGLVGGLVTTGVPEDEAKYYDEEVRSGRILVTVRAEQRADEAERILRGAGAYDFSTRGSVTGASGMPRAASGGTSGTARAAADAPRSGSEGTIRVPEVEERLQVEKRPVQRGEVRIEKTVTEEKKTVPVELQREEVHVERRDIAERPLKPGEDAFKEGTIKVPVRGEEAVAKKETVVTGEVVVNKERTTEREEVSDTLRRTEVHVDRSRQEVATPRGASGDADMYRGYAQELRADPRYKGRRFEEIEADLEQDWTHRNPGTPWERARAHIREAWTDARAAGR